MREKISTKTSIVTHTIKSGLAMVIPILFVGSISVLFNKFPVMAYQDFLDSFLGGALRSIIGVVQNATVGLLAVYITIALNISYVNRSKDRVGIVYRIGSMLGCLTGYFILVGFFVGEIDVTLLSGQGVFSAMIAGIVGSVLFKKFERLFNTEKKVFFDGLEKLVRFI